MLQYLEIAGVIVGLVYIYLEYQASVWLWLAGIVMPAIYIYVYYTAGFYADVGINIYYLVAGIYGWGLWFGRDFLKNKKFLRNDFSRNEITEEGESVGKGKKDADTLQISRMPRKYYLGATIICLAFFAVIAWILIKFTDSTVPYGDSITTAMSIVALWMLAHKYVEQWLVWIVVDLICCGLYFYKDLNYTAILYGVYAVIAVFGYFKWLRMMKKQNA